MADYDVVCSRPIFTIATSGFGNDELVNMMYDELLLTQEYSEQTFYLSSYGSEYEFLQQFSCILSEEFSNELTSDDNGSTVTESSSGTIVVKVVIHDVSMRQFVTHFPGNETGEKYRQKFMVEDDLGRF